jgi:hypothetical protein
MNLGPEFFRGGGYQMASPFPGMDPYLEQYWGDIHHRLITYASDALQKVLPNDLRARVEERVFVESPTDGYRPIIPDVRVIERPRKKPKPPSATAGLAVAEPLIVLTDEEVTQGFIEIRDASSGHRVVTVIEVLSPTNKVPGPGQEKYLQKRQELRDGGVSLVEIDLVRMGKRPLPVGLGNLPLSFRTTYQVWVRRGWELLKVEIYRVPLRERLPVIRIPLRQTDADVPLDLQALIEECYRNGGYEADIDYQTNPYPPLDASDARWANALLRKAGLRSRRRTRRRPQ